MLSPHYAYHNYNEIINTKVNITLNQFYIIILRHKNNNPLAVFHLAYINSMFTEYLEFYINSIFVNKSYSSFVAYYLACLSAFSHTFRCVWYSLLRTYVSTIIFL